MANMENGKIDTSVFEVLDDIKTKFDFNDYKWAEAAFGNESFQSRISEIRKLAKQAHKDEKTGRAFSYAKCVALVNGLDKLIGRATLNEELLKRLPQVKSTTERLLIMVLAMEDEDKEPAETLLKAIINKSNKSKKVV